MRMRVDRHVPSVVAWTSIPAHSRTPLSQHGSVVYEVLWWVFDVGGLSGTQQLAKYDPSKLFKDIFIFTKSVWKIQKAV
jgi:hypothetical protein